MNTTKFFFKQAGWLLLVLMALGAKAAIKLPALVSDGMVLQRDSRVQIWGWASPGESVSVSFNNKDYHTVTAGDGKWMVKLEPVQAGGPYDMLIKGNGSEIRIKNILMGDVWICSGQSNMALDFNSLKSTYPNEIANSANDQIRQILVNRTYSSYPANNFKSAGWKPANPQNLAPFTAAGYFFAYSLYQKYHVPIGLINSSIGGTMAEAWTNEAQLKQFPQFEKDVELLKDTVALSDAIKANKAAMAAWDEKANAGDQGYDASKNPVWASTGFDDSGWKTMTEPNYWFRGGFAHTYGVIWLRKEINITADAAGSNAVLKLGRIADADITFFNGQKVGESPNRDRVREYKIPSGLIKAGKNVITVRVTNYNGDGGLIPGMPLQLVSDKQTLSLDGDWKIQPGMIMPAKPGNFDPKNLPTSLFNAMISPLLNYTIKGVIWYQGEFNTHRAYEYRTLFPTMIEGWRAQFGQGDFPFIFQQLPNFQSPPAQPNENEWAELREAQLLTLSKEPNTAMSVAIDIGDGVLHPTDKKDIGIRLSLAARKLAYNEKDLVSSGPVYQSMRIEGNKIIINFTATGSGLIAKGGTPLKYFAIAGADKKFVWADAVIKDNTVEITAKDVPNPVAVRYAWAGNPDGCNLFNQEGLPASPFRTDDWPGLTYTNKYTSSHQ